MVKTAKQLRYYPAKSPGDRLQDIEAEITARNTEPGGIQAEEEYEWNDEMNRRARGVSPAEAVRLTHRNPRED